MKVYSKSSSDLEDCIARMQSQHHAEDLEGVTISALFVFDAESSLPILTHGGYPADAMVRLTPVRDRALGISDAVIVVDRARWSIMSAAQKDALIDHELMHLERDVDDDGDPKVDACNRPKLRIRRHDHQLGWFDDVARRHGDASPEIRQAKQLVEATSQLYFDFEKLAAPPSARRASRQAAAQH
jgi:hypothetical protein